MNLKFNIQHGFSLIALATLVLLISSPVSAVPSSGPSIGTNTYSTTPNVELGSVVAGKGQAVYASIYTFGGVDGSVIPIDTSADAFAEANSWFVSSIHQSGFSTYVKRAPSPVFAPDGLSLHLTYPATSQSQTLGWSADAAAAVEAEYGVTLSLTSMNIGSTHQYTWWANGSDTSSVQTSVSDDVVALGTNGLSQLLSTSTITSSPVFWSGYGARTLAGDAVVQFGAGWINTNGLTDMGSSTYALSSNTIFGGSVNPTSVSTALSRVTFRVPYPIAPTQGGITPATTNPLPHVTGIAQWDLKNPAGFVHDVGAQSDLRMEFKLKNNDTFPNVQAKFSVDQAKIASDGVLQGKFDLTNLGKERAEDIQVNLPLGPDFGKIVNGNHHILKMDSAYALNTNFGAKFNISINLNIPGFPEYSDSINEQFLNYSGWYGLAGDVNNIQDWFSGNDTLDLASQAVTYLGQSGSLAVSIKSTNGFPQFLLDAVNSFVKPALASADLTSFNSVRDALAGSLPQATNATLSATRDKYYVEQPVFTPQFGDFTLTSQTYAISEDQSRTYYFLSADFPALDPNQSATKSFNITNIPIEADTFQFIDLTVNSKSVSSTNGVLPSITMPDATAISSAENWRDVMKYQFERLHFDGRLLSFGYDASVSFGLDSYHSNQYISSGAYVTYNNTADYTFFSLTNGQNVQLADDEAVVSATIALDQQAYHPGDMKTANITLENLGDLPAKNIKVHLYEASLGTNWRFDRRHKIDTLTLANLDNGTSTSLTTTFEANSFTGYAPLYAYVEFDSDVGQGAYPLKDYLNAGIHEYAAAGETHHITYSTLTGSLLVQNGDASLNPILQEPKVDISKTTGTPDDNGQFDVTYTISNTGEAATEVYLFQIYESADLELVSRTTSDTSAIGQDITNGDYGAVLYSGINLAAGESATVTLTFKLLSDSATIWPAYAYFHIAGESTLGDSVDTGSSSSVANSLLQLSAGSQAQQESQQSANEDSSSSSYSASSSVGAAVQTGANDNTDAVQGIGFVGYDAIGFLALMAVPITITAFLRKRKS